MKRLATILLTLFLCAALCCCGAPQQSATEPEGTIAPEAAQTPTGSAVPSAPASAPSASSEAPDGKLTQSKTYQYLSTRTSGDYTVKLRTQTDAGTRTATNAVVDGRTVYSDIETDNGRFTNFEKDGKNYTVMHDTQTYLVTDAANVTQEEAGSNALYEAGHLGEPAAEGTVSIDGAEYAYEQFSVDGASVRYCFDGGDLRYILTDENGTETRLEVLSITGEVSPSLFHIPDGYQKIG